MNKQALWLRLKAYTFQHVVTPNLTERIVQMFGGTDASLHAFATKISNKHQWEKRSVLRAMEEYKKFVYLGVTQGFQVTPSSVIDMIWHEHILFSKAYREFCEEVLLQPFDHYPELVPIQDETGRFSAQYLDTLIAYKLEFGIDPPEAFWGRPKFDEQATTASTSRKKENYSDSVYSSEGPLVTSFEPAEIHSSNFSEFNGYGEGGEGFDGGGAHDTWSDASDTDSSDGGGDSGSDSGGCSGGCGGCGGGD